MVSIFPNLDWIWKFTEWISMFIPNAGNADLSNSIYGHFSRSDRHSIATILWYHCIVFCTLAKWLWRHKTISSNSYCFTWLIPQYNRSYSIYWDLFSEEVYCCIFFSVLYWVIYICIVYKYIYINIYIYFI